MANCRNGLCTQQVSGTGIPSDSGGAGTTSGDLILGSPQSYYDNNVKEIAPTNSTDAPSWTAAAATTDITFDNVNNRLDGDAVKFTANVVTTSTGASLILNDTVDLTRSSNNNTFSDRYVTLHIYIDNTSYTNLTGGAGALLGINLYSNFAGNSRYQAVISVSSLNAGHNYLYVDFDTFSEINAPDQTAIERVTITLFKSDNMAIGDAILFEALQVYRGVLGQVYPNPFQSITNGIWTEDFIIEDGVFPYLGLEYGLIVVKDLLRKFGDIAKTPIKLTNFNVSLRQKCISGKDPIGISWYIDADNYLDGYYEDATDSFVFDVKQNGVGYFDGGTTSILKVPAEVSLSNNDIITYTGFKDSKSFIAKFENNSKAIEKYVEIPIDFGGLQGDLKLVNMDNTESTDNNILALDSFSVVKAGGALDALKARALDGEQYDSTTFTITPGNNFKRYYGGQRFEVANTQTGSFLTKSALKNTHVEIDLNTYTGGTIKFTVNGGAIDENTSGVTVIDEEIFPDATGAYQTDAKFDYINSITVTTLDGTPTIDYDIFGLAYTDNFNTDFELLGCRLGIGSSGINPAMTFQIFGVKDLGNKKMEIVTIEDVSFQNTQPQRIDNLRGTRGLDTAGITYWAADEKIEFKAYDYDDYFTDESNTFLSKTKNEGYFAYGSGIPAGANMNNIQGADVRLLYRELRK